jgi:hypothetical protein
MTMINEKKKLTGFKRLQMDPAQHTDRAYKNRYAYRFRWHRQGVYRTKNN